ncbi:predicted protein [Fibroporia radiculosa]|uniref:Uncharacterized protein n=1 Tax=Fibroporia radiculosa TaxID=599839 RepID=J4I1T1_9APHY|nr:predicted protein [Fibroporia radiculosa]
MAVPDGHLILLYYTIVYLGT